MGLEDSPLGGEGRSSMSASGKSIRYVLFLLLGLAVACSEHAEGEARPGGLCCS